MKILWVKPGGLVPPDTGGKLRSYHILRELARRHSVTLFTFYEAHANDTHAELKQVVDRVVCCPLQLPARKSFAELRQYAGGLCYQEPFSITKYCRPGVALELRRLLNSDTYDIIICDFLIAAGVIPWNWPGRKVLFAHNVEALIWKRHYEVTHNPVWKVISWREWRAMARAEQSYLRRADHVIAVSETDRDFFKKFLDPAKLTVVPTGVDVDYFQPVAGAEQPNLLVFVGSMDWRPNEDGVRFFAKEILSRIRRQVPDTLLSVVGRNPSDRLKVLAVEENLRLTGRVDDIRPFVAQGAVCVVPLRVASGTRLKIFEAMAMGKAVVSTSIGAEGLPVQHGQNILLADHPRQFAESVVALLQNPVRRNALGRAARTFVESKYSWAAVADAFDAILANVASKSLSTTNAAVGLQTTD